MDNYQQKVGKYGEKIAKEYLIKKGYEILAQHFYIRGGEIDLIAKIGQKIVFVEVKSRTSLIYGLPEDAVNIYKLQALKRAAEIYLNKKRILGQVEIGFDIISVLINSKINKIKIKHFQDIDISLE